MEQRSISSHDTLCSDETKPFIKEENIENRQLPLLSKKKLKPVQRARFQKRLPNINAAVKRTQIPTVDISSNSCDTNEVKESLSEKRNEDNLETQTTHVEKAPPLIESIPENPESIQSHATERLDKVEPSISLNTDNSGIDIFSRPVLKRNVPTKVLHRTPFLKKPLPNIRNVSKSCSSASQEQTAIEDSKRSSKESQNEDLPIPKACDVEKKTSAVDNIHPNQESDQSCTLKESDATEQPFSANSENSSNELNILSPVARKNTGSKVVRRAPFVKKPVPNVRNAGKSSGVSLEEMSKTTPSEKSRRLSGCNDEEPSTPNATAVPNSVKFPHITSILSSKKRNFKEKEVPNKRRKYLKGDGIEKNKMTIMDLIYYNPSENPMQYTKSKPLNNNIFVPKPSEELSVDSGAIEVTEDNIRPVPKLVVNENGDINIDESSLVVQRNVDSTIVETVIEDTTYSSFRRKPAKQWGKNETVKFYKALSLVGTDFGLMEKLMPDRTRRELKLKFKREEKHNLDYINRAMYDSQTFDINILLEENVEDTENSERSSVDGSCALAEVSVAKTCQEKKIALAEVSVAKTCQEKKIALAEVSVAKTCQEKKIALAEVSVAKTCQEKKIGKKRQNGKRGRNKKTIDSSNDKPFALSDESLDSNSQNSCEQDAVSEIVLENSAPDILESSPQKSLSTPMETFEDINSGMKMGVTNSRRSNEVVEIEFAYSRRNRKPKRLAEGFIDMDDLDIDEKDEIYDCIPESEMDSFVDGEIQPEENEILELQREIERSKNLHQASVIVNSSEQSKIIASNMDLTDTDVISNVVADEVVPYKKRYTKKSRKPNVNISRMQSVQQNAVSRPSFTKYTPVEEFPSYKESDLEFTPDRNLRTYTRGNAISAPRCPNFLVSSMQSPSARTSDQSQQSTSLVTSLNVTSNQSFTIPVTPEANAKDASCSSVMIFAKAPDQENILHLFMYNKADTELNSANCKVESLVDCS